MSDSQSQAYVFCSLQMRVIIDGLVVADNSSCGIYNSVSDNIKPQYLLFIV